LRIKEQGKRLTFNEHDDDDDEVDFSLLTDKITDDSKPSLVLTILLNFAE
jgi:hypothetical protein